jgi:hypothetical protein
MDNDHEVSSQIWDGRIGKDGRIYAASGTVNHPEHQELRFGKGGSSHKEPPQWYTFYRNTAVKSVSTQGVD